MAFEVGTELIRIWIMTGFTSEGSSKIKTVFTRITVMGSISAFIGVNAAISVMLNNTLSETFWVVSTWVIVTNTDVVRIGKPVAFIGSWDIDTILMNCTIIVSKKTFVIINACVVWWDRLLEAAVA